MQTQLEKNTKKPIKVNEIEMGDVFSEESHYVYLGLEGSKYKFKHLESGVSVKLDEKYVGELLTSADQYDETEIEVGREDKFWTQKQIDTEKAKGNIDDSVREGDLKIKGIRSLWTDIHSGKVLSVCFLKQAKELTKKAVTAAKAKQLQEALVQLSSGKATMEEVITTIQSNPVQTVQPGEERVLRGYKIQFTSANGFYDVIDMDIEDPENKGLNIRKVNINEIQWLVLDGIKYNVV